MSYAAVPCRHCGDPIVIVGVLQPDGTHRPVPMDPTTRVYHRLVESDSGAPRGFWIEDVAPKGETRQSLARHACRGAV